MKGSGKEYIMILVLGRTITIVKMDVYNSERKWKGKYNKTATIDHQCKDLKKHCNINGHTEEKCWKIHLEMNPKNCKKDDKKKNHLPMNSSKEV